MYDSPNYLNREMLEKILSEYEWPTSYSIGDDDCPFDGIEVVFLNVLFFLEKGYRVILMFYFRSFRQTLIMVCQYLMHYIMYFD